MKPLSLLISILAILFAAGCATEPKTIEGQKVIGKRLVNGKVVYIVEGDKEAERRGLAEMREATRGAVIQPVN